MIVRFNYPCVLIFLTNQLISCQTRLNGRYTKNIHEYDLVVPHKLTPNGEFITFKIPHFVEHDFKKRKRRNSDDYKNAVHYGIHINGDLHHIELTPNHNFISPNLVVEHRDPRQNVQDMKMKRVDQTKMCHFTGNVRNKPSSRAALSTCDGLAGYVTVDNTRYFIEPLEDHVPNQEGAHLHLLYTQPINKRKVERNTCGTNENWEEAWKKRFRQMERGELYKDVEKRGLKSEHRYLETLVVCDKRFLEHHKNTDYEAYVMTLMNMVADFYHDATSGNQMDVVVVRIIYLEKEEEEIDLAINPDADKTLKSFCQWQMKVNPKDKTNPNHHDIAVLITRYDICADNMSNCGLMGLAYVAAACTQDEPCAINEDGGLATGIVVAHEMGHVMGCAHDKEGESSCPAQDTDESYFVMAPYVHLFTIRWSTCSRGFMTSLFENNLGDCLNNEPKDTIFKFRNVLPGTIYDAEAQCNLVFPNSQLCQVDKDRFCEMLVCRTSPTECMSKEEPVADGTKCGENKWCYRRECVEMGERPEAINGGWGDWSDWTSCSRTCGLGVSTAERECNNPMPQNKGRYCIGDRKKIKTCNPEPCPEGGPSFREIQCTETNSEPFNNMLMTWKPYMKKEEPCALYCINEQNQFAKRQPRVKDGTRCRPGSKDVCVSGSCLKVGCDGVLDSDAVEDICGICNGDGTQCKIIDDTYTDLGAVDYKKVVTIPAESRKILIDELGPSGNTIAISDKTERHFYLNGDHREEQDGAKKFGTDEGVYTHIEPGRENLVINGPLKDDLILWVCFYEPGNVGYHYQYAQLSKDVSYQPKYHWELVEWSDCSVKCGGGFAKPIFDCIEEKSGKVSSKFCENTKPPDDQPKKCNEEPCKTKWKVGSWGECQACRDKSGVRIREVECVRESGRPGTQDILVEDKECKEPKPGSRELCNAHKTCNRRRHTDNLPDHLMAKVWKQTRGRFISKRCNEETTQNSANTESSDSMKGPNLSNNDNSESMRGQTQSSVPKISLKVGTIIKDTVPSEEIKLVEIPFMQSHLTLNLSDSAFETMGDEVADTLDLDNAKIITGSKAAEYLKVLENQNNTPSG